MKTSFKMVAMLLGIGVFPVCAQAQKKNCQTNRKNCYL